MQPEASLQNSNRRVHLISLGCSRNRVDSEVMLGTLFGRGWSHSEEISESDAVIVNTCGFIGSAKQESVDTILDCAEHKKDNPGLKLVVTGCLTQRYKNQLADNLPEVDLFIGTDEFTRLGELLDGLESPTTGVSPEKVHAKRTHYLYNDAMPRINTLSNHSAYVKIAEGCQHNCSFCIIPAIRGRLRSRPIPSVVTEVANLVANGVVEVNLIAQDLAAYGRDKGQDELLPLLKALVQIDGLRWIRLLYIYPEHISEEFLQFFASEPKLVKYLDIPMQHASNRILKEMKRDVTREFLLETIERVRKRVPGVAIRTSVMVGFPGESEEDFADLLDFVSQAKIDHLGCFQYSQEEGTVAGRMKNQVSEDLKASRQHQVMELQKQISSEKLSSYVGKTVSVLTAGVSDESDLVWEGRMSVQAPEVDGKIYLTDGELKPGQIQQVIIDEAHEYDLVGRVLN